MPRPVRGKLRQVSPKGSTLVFGINPESVVVSGGTGGWERIQRPRRRTALEWNGTPERVITFTLILDGWPDRSVEADIRTLEEMSHPRAPRKPPPELELDFGRMGGRARWVIDDLSWGDELRDAQLNRIRQDVTITLVEYIEATITLSPVERHNSKKGSGGSGSSGSGVRIYVVKAGDTLGRIAAKLLGKASDWPRIAKLNNIRDPNRITVGQRLRVPKG